MLACVVPDKGGKWTKQELAFLCWTRETGWSRPPWSACSPASACPTSTSTPASSALAIILTLLLQALPAARLADRLGLLEAEAEPAPASAELG